MQEIGGIVKRGRVRMGMTQGDLAARIGVTTSAICDLERGNRANQPAPDELVNLSDALMDRAMLHEYCDSCPVRSRILIRKFPPLNNIITGAHVSAIKVSQKLSEAADLVSAMLQKMTRKGFEQDPDYREFRNEAVIKILDVKRGAEILLDQMQDQGVITADELRMLVEMQQRLCEEKGHHVPSGAEA